MSATTHHTLADCQPVNHQRTVRTADTAEWISRAYRRWRERSRERQTFALLGYRELRDIGVSRWEAEREMAKPFWRG
jgi:uncharacterized protein YjiS (DUF1127 family)